MLNKWTIKKMKKRLILNQAALSNRWSGRTLGFECDHGEEGTRWWWSQHGLLLLRPTWLPGALPGPCWDSRLSVQWTSLEFAEFPPGCTHRAARKFADPRVAQGHHRSRPGPQGPDPEAAVGARDEATGKEPHHGHTLGAGQGPPLDSRAPSLLGLLAAVASLDQVSGNTEINDSKGFRNHNAVMGMCSNWPTLNGKIQIHSLFFFFGQMSLHWFYLFV